MSALGRGAVLTVSSVYPDVTAFEHGRDRAQADASLRPLRGQVGSLARRGSKWELFELLSAPGGPPLAPARYYVWVPHHVAAGRQAEARAILTEHVEAARAAGQAGTTLLGQLFPSGCLVIGAFFADLGAYERARAEGADGLAATMSRLAPLLREPPRSELQEVLARSHG